MQVVSLRRLGVRRIPALLTAGVAAMGLLATTMANAQAPESTWPARPLRLIVPFATGGGTDLVGRLVGQKLSDRLGQPVVVDNRAGAGGNIGTEAVARAAPDGYTLLLAYASHASNVSLYARLPFDPVADFAPIGMIATLPNLLVVHPDLPVRSVADLIALARAKPGQLNFGSGGVGTPNHLSGEMFKAAARIDVRHVPYKGIGPSNLAQIAGEVQFSVPGLFTVLQAVRAGRIRAIAVTSLRRSEVAPDVPTLAESGLPDFEAISWYGLLAPARTPPALISRLNLALNDIVNEPAMRQSLLAMGNEPETGTPAQFSQRISADIARWSNVIRAAGIRVDE